MATSAKRQHQRSGISSWRRRIIGGSGSGGIGISIEGGVIEKLVVMAGSGVSMAIVSIK